MRIERVNLIAYGPFSGEILEFEKLGRDFHIIYGPNEAGKSSLLRALTAAIFGIPERTEDNFLHHNDQLRIGMTLRRKDGEILPFVRKKGRRKTLLDQEERPLEESVLTTFWGPLEESHFCNTFGLNHERLVKGGEDIIAGGGEIGQSLFEAGSGLVGLPKLLLGLEEEAGKIFRPQGRTLALNQSLERYNKARGEVKQFSLKSDEWSRLQTNLGTAAAALQAKGVESQNVRKTRSQMERILSNLPALAKRSSLLGVARELTAIPDLPEDAGTERIRAVSEQKSAEGELQLIEERIESLTKESETVQVKGDLLSYSGQIDDLYKNIGSFRDASRDIPKRQIERAAALSLAAEALKGIRPDLSLEKAETVRLTQPQMVEIRRLIREDNELKPKLENSRNQVNEIIVEIDLIRQAIERHPKQVDVGRLTAAIATVKGLGDLENRNRQAASEIDSERTRIETELLSLPLWKGDIDAFERTAFPSTTTVNRFKSFFDEIDKERLLIEDQANQQQRKHQELAGELERLQASGDVPSPTQLQETRIRRDLGWRLIREAFIEKTRSVDEAAAAFDPTHPLPYAYEKSVAGADQIADLLYKDSDRVARHESVKRELRQQETEIGKLQEKVKALEVRRREVTEEWERHWKSAGISPLPPQDMSEWLQRRERILDRIQTFRGKEEQALQLQKAIEDGKAILNSALSAMAQPVAEEDEGLQPLLLRCDRLLDQITESNTAVNLLNRKLTEHESKLRTAHNRLDGIETALAKWEGAWKSATAPIGLGFDASTQQVQSVLESLDAVFNALKEVEAFDHRLRGMDETVNSYTHRVGSLLEAVAPNLREMQPDESVEALHRRYQTAKKEVERREYLQSEIKSQNEQLGRVRRKVSDAEMQLASLCKQAGCKNVEDLPAIETKAAEKQHTAKTLKELEDELIQRNSRSLEEIVNEASGVDRDALPGQIANIKEEEARLQDEQLALAEEVANAKGALRLLDGGDVAAAAAEQAQSALAEIRNGAESYVRLQLSSVLLRRAIDLYRERNQGPLLSRAGSFFSSLTLGRFKRLKSEYNEQDQPILVGVRANGDRVPVSGMSDGSADQLYFSLRLAAIERYSEAGEPCPLILDDILIQFDNDRARAALKILHELSAKTQILFFTHHAHLVGLAKETLSLSLKGIHPMTPRLVQA